MLVFRNQSEEIIDKILNKMNFLRMILNCIFPRVSDSDWEDSIPDPVDAREIFDLIRNINDPEHPLSLEQLDVVKIDDVDVNDNGNRVKGWKISKCFFLKVASPQN